jgi:DNA-binding beta-propeller fold protein YncE
MLIRTRTTGPVLIGLMGLLLAASALAQTPTWTAPSSGYLYDSYTQSIRSIVGFAGSAYLGPSVVSGLDWASLAPNQQSALVVSGGVLSAVADLASPDRLATISPAYTPQQALWSSDSNRAVFLTANGQLVWLTNLASAPLREASWDLERGRPGRELPVRWTLLAADSAADRVLLASRGDARWQLWWASPTVSPVSIALAGEPTAAVFSSGSAAFVADAAGHQILQIQNLDGGPTVALLFSSKQYVADPIGMAVSVDGSRIFVTDGAAQTVRSFDSGTGALLDELPYGSNAVSMICVSPGRFLLNPPGGTPAPLFFLDTGQPPRVFFIPRGAQ